MNDNKYLLEYLSMILILSYFFIHSIYLVFIGIIISVYLINVKLVNKIINILIIKLNKENPQKNYILNNKHIISNSNDLELNENNSSLSLVETIEELGFIPSINEKGNEPVE